MKFLLAFLLMLIGCMPAKAPTAQELHSATVIVSIPGSFCSGTWISGNRILTAAHCVMVDVDTDQDGEPDLQLPLNEVKYTNDDPEVGWQVARLLKTDVNGDLALLQAGSDAPLHKFMRVAERDPQQGDHVRAMGHVMGQAYSYREGVVSSVRSHETYTSKPVIQLDMTMGEGDSGCAIVDDRGQIVGVFTRYMNPVRGLATSMASGFALATHRDVIEELVQ